jgi:hypothetical protein
MRLAAMEKIMTEERSSRAESNIIITTSMENGNESEQGRREKEEMKNEQDLSMLHVAD